MNKLFLTIGTTFGIQAMGLLSGAILARSLGVEGRGALATVILWPSILVYLGDLGGPIAYVVQTAESPGRIPNLIANAVLLTLGQSVAIIAIGMVLIPHILSSNPDLVTMTLLFMCIYTPINLMARYLNAINQGAQSFGAFNAVRIAIQLGYVLGLILLAAFSVATVTNVIVVTLLNNLVTLSLTSWFALRGIRLRAIRPSLGDVSTTIKFGATAHIGNLTPVDSMRLDLAAVTALLGVVDAGIYTVATAVASMVRAYGTTFGLIALPKIAAGRNADEKRRVALTAFRQAFLFTIALASALALVTPKGIQIVYGSEFKPAIHITLVLLLGLSFASLRQVLGDCLRGAGDPKSGTAAEIVSWIVLALLALPSLNLLGLAGIAWSVTASYFASLLACSFFGRQSLNYEWHQLLPRFEDIREARLHLQDTIQRNPAIGRHRSTREVKP